MSSTGRSIELLHVTHASTVAAIPTSAGPEHLLEAGLERRLAALGAEVRVRELDLAEGTSSNPVADSFRLADRLSRAVAAALGKGRTAVVLSGSCHTALGSVAGLPAGRRGVLWLDCHGDFNTPETSPSGLLDGTVLATITGRCWATLRDRVEGFTPVDDDAVLMIGVRDLDAGEVKLLEASSIRRIGTEQAKDAAAEILAGFGRGVDTAYVHFDLDVMDASAGRANAWARVGGFASAELAALFRAIARTTPVRAIGLASYDPSADADGRACEAALGALEAFFEEAWR